MTTLSQLDKIANRWFNNKMRRRGFAVEKKLTYWRKRGPLFDMLWSEVLSGGELRLGVTIWSPWIDNADGELEQEFPPASFLIGGDLSEDFPESMHSGEQFVVDTEEAANETFRRILELVDARALPWFLTVNTYETYMAYVGRRGFHPTPEYREKIKAGISRGFELEPFV